MRSPSKVLTPALASGTARHAVLLPLFVLVALSLDPLVRLSPLAAADADVPGATPAADPVLRTPPAGPAPRLHGPLVFGVRPGHPFVYRIPCTGQRPLAFSVEGLPAGIALQAGAGILRGRAPTRRGEHLMTLTARNEHGEARRPFTLVVGDRLALTPPMGWNSWYIHYDRVTEKHMREAAEAMVSSGMADFGYLYVNIDDCWMKKKGDEPLRGPDGAVLPNAKFPDLAGMVEAIHALGLRSGVYTSPGPWTCAGYAGSHGHEEADARAFAAWGFDFLKYDWCSYEQVATGEGRERLMAPYRRMGRLLEALDRDIVLNLCQYGMGEVWEWGAEVGGHAWRTTGDLGLERGDKLPGFYRIGLSNAQRHEHAGPGAWNDPDYILIGRVGSAHSMGEGEPTRLTPGEQYSYMSMWCLMAAPLIFSGDMAALDPLTLNVLCNGEVIDVDQDPLGKQARIVRQSSDEVVLAKPLQDGAVAIGLFNLAEEAATLEIRRSELGIEGPRRARDLWRQRDLGPFEDVFSAEVARHDVVLIRLAGPGAPPAVGEAGLGGASGSGQGALDLAGTWRFALDRSEVGVGEEWFQQPLPGEVHLPGSLEEEGLGDAVDVNTPWTGDVVDRSWYESPRYAPYREPGHIKVPFWLQPRTHYRGVAWYQRDVTIPTAWTGRRITLFLERCHWETRVWVDQQEVGRGESLATPLELDLTGALSPGSHRLTLRVDNRLLVDVGANAHSVSDHTQGNWNGVIGALELRTSGRVWIAGAQVYADLAGRAIEARISIGNATGKACRAQLLLDARTLEGQEPARDPPARRVSVEVGPGETTRTSVRYALAEGDTGGIALWSEHHPALYRLDLALEADVGGKAERDTRQVRFGMREVRTDGTRFTLNGRPIQLRGTLECCVFPQTGYPPTDVDEWRRILSVCRDHGLNHLRFHSWCPPEAAFDAADELGFYYQVECGAWATVGGGAPVDAWIYREADRILEAYGNHPSFVLMAHGNEPSGPENGARYLGPWVSRYRGQDSRRLYTSASGWPLLEESQFHVTPAPRIQQWGEGRHSRINARPPETETDYRDFVRRHRVPVISHEIGQWCAYPDFDEIAEYTGWLRPANFEIFRDLLVAHGMGDQARSFLEASGKLQVLCYKEEVESALRTPGLGGFQLLGLGDFPGQGTALVGVVNPFWRSKPYVTAQAFRRFCGPTVPLARLARRIFTVGEHLEVAIEVSCFGPEDLEGAVVSWRLEETDGKRGIVASGSFPPRTLRTGALEAVGRASADLSGLEAPARLRLLVSVEGTAHENDWDVWVYPREVEEPAAGEVLEVAALEEPALERLRSGGKVLLVIPPDRVAGGVVTSFSSVFWNTAWTRNQPPHTLGLLCDPAHPALARFPTAEHTDWQWWEVIHDAGAMVIDDLPGELRPIVQLIDTWFEARRLALVFEARVAGGKLLVASADLASGLSTRPAARQLRHSLLAYMASGDFDPRVGVEVEGLRRLFRAPSLTPPGAR